MASFRWDSESHRAALQFAIGDLSVSAIATQAGVTRQTLFNWRKNPEFRAKVEEHLEEFRDQARRSALADVSRRVGALHDRWRRMQQIIELRAESLKDDCQGGQTGLMCRKVAGWVGAGEDREPVYEYEFDAALLRELREHEKQAAQELGQWTERMQSEVRATVVIPARQQAMLGNERAIELACDLEREISRPGDRDSDAGGVCEEGE